jgi:hypothetical protein
MKRSFYVGLLAVSLAAPAGAAGLRQVTMTGGFQAEAHREIATGPARKAMVYSVLGAISLKAEGEDARPLSAECLGFDEQGGGTAVVGTGRCVWKDSAGDSLFLSIGTSGEQNVYTVTGGTGKWSGAHGQLRTKFTYLPAPQGVLLINEAGGGRLSAPEK